MKEVVLKVQEALQEEAYKGIVRIDSQTMRQIEVKAGDIIEIESGRKTVGIVDRAYPSDIGQAIIRMDGIIRRNAKTGIGENVKVRKAEVHEAKSIIIAPAQKGVMIQANPEIFKQGLLGRALIKGDILSLGGARRRRRTMTGSPFEDIFGFSEEIMNFGFGTLKFIVADAAPKGPVIITENSEVRISAKAVEVMDEKVPEVTYEDIGGLDEEMKKIREMVELPLRNPEIFERLGIDAPKGVLLFGPPGTGKTLLAKAVANETNANFLMVNGPELTSKFYGECVADDTLLLTNGAGLTTIQETILGKDAHKVAGLNLTTQKVEMLEIDDKYNKGVKETIAFYTPHGEITVTPTSKLLVLNGLDLEWKEANDIHINDRIATVCKLPKIYIEPPSILGFLKENNYVKGNNVRAILNSIQDKHANIARHLGVSERKYEDWKYNKSLPIWALKKLVSKYDINKLGEELKLLGKGKIPTQFNEKLLYVLGLLMGDGHLRYNYKLNHVTTVNLTNADQNVIKAYREDIKDIFDIDVKTGKKYDHYFSSSIIGTFLHKLGIPKRRKAQTIEIPPYLYYLDDELIISFLRGLYDSDGHVHEVKSGLQIQYYTTSKKMFNGVKLLLLRLNIQSTYKKRKDGTYELTVSDAQSIKRFKSLVKLNNIKRSERLAKDIPVKYEKPIYNRVPIKCYVGHLMKKYRLSKNSLRIIGVNPYCDSYSREAILKLREFLTKYGVDAKELEKLELLAKNDLIFTPVKRLENGTANVYDLTVPKDHNFIANGFVVHNSEKRIRDLFEEAQKNAPSIIFIDEIDSIAPAREEVYGEVERRMVAQLLAVMDGIKSRGKVIVIAATNRPNSLDPALRRPGRFDREIVIGVPNKKGRLKILQIHTRNMPLAQDVKIEQLAEVTHGFVGADLEALCKEAAMNVLRRELPNIKLEKDEPLPPETLAKLSVLMSDFKAALKIVRPSALREVLIEAPNIHWDDVGGLEDLKSQLCEAVELPLKKPESFQRLGIRPPKGILLYGPSGCGKTLLAKAVATESEANFILVKGPELLNKFIGESEKGVRKVFEKARQTAPTIIFFDEIDALAPRRGLDLSSQVTERVVNALLAEMDGLEELSEVVILGATNRPDLLDPALLRPGRFDRVVLTPLPDKIARLSIFKIYTKNMPLAKDINLEKFAEQTERYSGADISGICREAGLAALRRDPETKEVTKKDFEESLERVHPSLRDEDIKRYKELEDRYLKAARVSQVDHQKISYFG